MAALNAVTSLGFVFKNEELLGAILLEHFRFHLSFSDNWSTDRHFVTFSRKKDLVEDDLIPHRGR